MCIRDSLERANSFFRKAYKWSELGVSPLAEKIRERVLLAVESERIKLVETSTTQEGVVERETIGSLHELDTPPLSTGVFEPAQAELLDERFTNHLTKDLQIPWHKIHRSLLSPILKSTWSSTSASDLSKLLRVLDRSLVLKATLGRQLSYSNTLDLKAKRQLEAVIGAENELRAVSTRALRDSDAPDEYMLARLSEAKQKHREAVSDLTLSLIHI